MAAGGVRQCVMAWSSVALRTAYGSAERPSRAGACDSSTRLRMGSAHTRCSTWQTRWFTRGPCKLACDVPALRTTKSSRLRDEAFASSGETPATTCSVFLPFSTRLGCWDEQAQCGAVPHRRHKGMESRRKESNLLTRSRQSCSRPRNRCHSIASPGRVAARTRSLTGKWAAWVEMP